MTTTLPGASYKEEGKKRRRRMEVLAEPTVGLNKHVGLPPVFLHDESSESSSIGIESSSSEEDHGGGGDGGGEDEVQSKPRDGALGSLESLNESLPIKRGLSNFLTGKSKSFASLSAIGSVSTGDLVKPENPFNKRRRIIMACKSSWLRRASYCSLITSLPRHTLDEGEEEEEEVAAAAAGGGDDGSSFPGLPGHHNGNDERKVKRVLRSPRSFSLSDLQHA